MASIGRVPLLAADTPATSSTSNSPAQNPGVLDWLKSGLTGAQAFITSITGGGPSTSSSSEGITKYIPWAIGGVVILGGIAMLKKRKPSYSRRRR